MDDYQNFELQFTNNGDHSYNVMVKSPLGPAAGTFEFFKEDARDQKNYGATLFNKLFTSDIIRVFQANLTQFSSDPRRLRICLRLDKTPELHAIAWELLYDTFEDRFLALTKETPVVRVIEPTRKWNNQAFTFPFDMLLVTARPKDFPLIDWQREWRNIASALRELTSNNQIRLTKLRKAKAQNLQSATEEKKFQLIHFTIHGGFSPDLRSGGLVFEDDQQQKVIITARKLSQIIGNRDSVRLIVLNSCHTARTDESLSQTGVAQSLVSQGVPVVIAMQSTFTQDAGAIFAKAFYESLSDKSPLEHALTDARKSLYIERETEWQTPTLFMRGTEDPKIGFSTISPSVPLSQISQRAIAFQNTTRTLLNTRALEEIENQSKSLVQEAAKILRDVEELSTEEKFENRILIDTVRGSVTDLLTFRTPHGSGYEFEVFFQILEALNAIKSENNFESDSERFLYAQILFLKATTGDLPMTILPAVARAKNIFLQLGYSHWVQQCDLCLRMTPNTIR